MTVIIIVVAAVLGVGSAVLYALYRVLATALGGPETAPATLERRGAPTAAEPTGPISAEGLVLLFADTFAVPAKAGQQLPQRRRCLAPLTGDELDARDVAEKMLFAAFAELHEEGCIDLVITASEPTLMPPFPHKNWTLSARRVREFPRGPMLDALADAFREAGGRHRRRGRDPEQPVAVDELIELAVSRMRRDRSFWERAGVYADIRAHVETHLVDQGYLVLSAGDTWLDRFRFRRAVANEGAAMASEGLAQELRQRLDRFRQEHASKLPPPEGPGEESIVSGVHRAVTEGAAPLSDLGIHDGLRVSIAEALLSLRALEPSDTAGM